MSWVVSAGLQAAQLALPELVGFKPNRGIYQILLPDGKSTLPDIIAPATIEEKHIDRMEVTRHPVERGAAISDHAFALPSEVILHIGWSNSIPASKKQAMIQQIAELAAAWAQTAGHMVGGAAGAVGTGIGAAVGVGTAISNLVSAPASQIIIDAYNSLLDLYYSRGLFTLHTGKRDYQNMLIYGLSTETDNTTENSLLITVECMQIIVVDTQTAPLPAAQVANPKDNASLFTSGSAQTTLSNQSLSSITPNFTYGK